MDEAVVECTKAVGIDRQSFGNASAEALDGDVGGFCQFMHQRPPLLRFHIDRDASLVAVGAQKHGAELRRRKGRPSPSFIALPHRFDLDDLRTEITQILRAQRTSENF